MLYSYYIERDFDCLNIVNVNIICLLLRQGLFESSNHHVIDGWSCISNSLLRPSSVSIIIHFLMEFTLLLILCLWLGYQGIHQWSLRSFLLLYVKSQTELHSEFLLSNYYVFPSSSINSKILESCHALLLV